MKGEPIVILHVEDDPAHAELVKRIVEDFNIANRLTHVEDGQAALDYLFQREAFSDAGKAPRPGLILLDLRLPKVDGLEVLRIIKADPALARIPVVVLTTSSAEKDLHRAYDHHVNSYLVKPVEFTKFIELMKNFGFYWLAWNTYPY